MPVEVEELTEKQLLKEISDFSNKIKRSRPREALEFPDGIINGEYTNRGNKLKLGSRKVHRDHIDGLNNDIEDVELIHYNRAKRAVIKRRRLDTYNHSEHEGDEGEEVEGEDAFSDDDFDDDDDDYDDPYSGIDLEKILAPIQQPSDLVTRDAISKTYKSDVLRHLSQQAIEIIEKEQETVIQLSSLLDIFLGEDSSQLLEARLELPEYDHNLTEKPDTPQSPDGGNNASINTAASNASNVSTENHDELKRITRKSVTNEQDPFFALPKMKIDLDFGLSASDAEDARQLSQIALQRNEEFIRNLTNLRNGLSRAQYVKERLFNWAKEINGDPDESDIYQRENVVNNKSGNIGISNVGKEDGSSSENGTPAPATTSAPTPAPAPAPAPSRRGNRRR